MNFGEVAGILNQVCQLTESLLNSDGTSIISLSILLGGNVVPGIGINIALKGQNRCGSSIGSLEPLWILNPEPSCQHTSIRASTDNNSPISQILTFFKVSNETNIVKHCLLRRELIVVGLIGVTLIPERHGLSKESVFAKDNQRLVGLGEVLSHEARVVVERPDVALVARVEENWAC